MYNFIKVFCPRAGPSLQTQAAVLLGTDRWESFPLLSTPHSLFSIWTDQKIPGTPAWMWGEWIWLTWPCGLHRNSPQGLNISSIRVFDQIRDQKSQSLISSSGVNFFRRTMHSKSLVVNLAEQHETLLANKWLEVCNSQLLLIFKKAVPIHLFYFNTKFSKYKWLYYFIIPQVISRHFFIVGKWKWIATDML